MKSIATTYIVEAKGQRDEHTTPALYGYKPFGTLKAAQEHLDTIYRNASAISGKTAKRLEDRVEVRDAGKAYPFQYWVIKTHHITVYSTQSI